MSKIQEIFNRIQETKREQREIKSMYRDTLANSERHKNVVEDLKQLKEKKKQIETSFQEEFSREFDKLDNLKADLENDNQLLADAVIAKVSKGEVIEVRDEHQTEYEPIFSVRFKKV